MNNFACKIIFLSYETVHIAFVVDGAGGGLVLGRSLQEERGDQDGEEVSTCASFA